MKKFVPYEKLSKKQQKEVDQRKRTDWGVMCPVSRRPENSNVYNRKKHQLWKDNHDAGAFCYNIDFGCHTM